MTRRLAVKKYAAQNKGKKGWRENIVNGTYLSDTHLGKVVSDNQCGEKAVNAAYFFLKRNGMLSSELLKLGDVQNSKKHARLEPGAIVKYKKAKYMVKELLTDIYDKKKPDVIPISANRMHHDKVLKNTTFYIDEPYQLVIS